MCAHDYDPRYLGYFDCFNRQQFFEAHEVLEALWLPQRNGPNGLFYKGLIQLAGAFVHWQKNRPGPGVALFKLAQTNLRKYPTIHEGLSVTSVLVMADEWLSQLTASPPVAFPSALTGMPRLRLEAAPGHGTDRCDGAE
jgi:predicted metal-dependent hydrolase